MKTINKEKENVENAKTCKEEKHAEWLASMNEQIDALKYAIWLESQGMHSEYDY